MPITFEDREGTRVADSGYIDNDMKGNHSEGLDKGDYADLAVAHARKPKAAIMRILENLPPSQPARNEKSELKDMDSSL
jgi:hypothetical protein